MPAYSQRFFEVQLIFARAVAALAHQPFSEAVLRYTALYRILNVDGQLDPTQPVWQAYVRGLGDARRDAGWTHHFYLDHRHLAPTFNGERLWGCFSYDYLADRRTIGLHFSHQDTSGYGPLSRQRRVVRMDELRAMFGHIKRVHPDATSVTGGSWLYNRDAYRRLFPPAYVQSARVGIPGFRYRNLWGQFLRHDGQVNEDVAAPFLQNVGQLRGIERASQCFPYQVLDVHGPILDFYTFYRI